jgi:hypothetical protein
MPNLGNSVMYQVRVSHEAMGLFLGCSSVTKSKDTLDELVVSCFAEPSWMTSRVAGEPGQEKGPHKGLAESLFRESHQCLPLSRHRGGLWCASLHCPFSSFSFSMNAPQPFCYRNAPSSLSWSRALAREILS